MRKNTNDFEKILSRLANEYDKISKEDKDKMVNELIEYIEKEKNKTFMEGYQYAISILLESIVDKDR